MDIFDDFDNYMYLFINWKGIINFKIEENSKLGIFFM
jgi:hypothetical protein